MNCFPQRTRQLVHHERGEVHDRHHPHRHDADSKGNIDQLCCALVCCDARNEKVRSIKLDIGVQCERKRVNAREENRERAEVFVQIL